jgi:hypothetical protein
MSVENFSTIKSKDSLELPNAAGLALRTSDEAFVKLTLAREGPQAVPWYRFLEGTKDRVWRLDAASPELGDETSGGAKLFVM